MNIRLNNEICAFEYMEDKPEECNEYYYESFIRYLNIFFDVFEAAFNKCEFSSLLTLLSVRGIEDAGWDPYKSSIQIIDSIIDATDKIHIKEVQRNIHLWVYGHIMEASEPYEMVMNLLDIIDGEEFKILKFPLKKSGVPLSPGEKQTKIVGKAKQLGFNKLEKIYAETWDRDLRNAVVHSDYCLLESEVRIRKPIKIYTSQEINKIVNRSYAYFHVIKFLHSYYTSSYSKPKVIKPHPMFNEHGNCLVIVREDYGAIGIKDNYTSNDISAGAIPYRIGRFYPEEEKMLESNPLLAVLPKRDM
ncbi:MAG: hypothetical protein CVU91_05935 [Firmicutes bacterium HGW-Firmicutes-16]|nr:MAG: hypothetical protein CVU91_05935 [Firmicutes bacterium HGW-Firmicutes-16]